MPPVNSLISKFENITQQEETLVSDTQRVRVKRYSMPLRQSTLNFSSSPATGPKRRSMGVTPSKQVVHAATPPVEEDDGDTIVVNMTAVETHVRIPLPTPSESATDVSSQSSSTNVVKSPPRSRSKRVSTLQNNASKETVKPSPVKSAATDKQRNISGETLVQSATMSQTSLLKNSIDALDMTWNMSDVFEKEPVVEETEVQPDDESTLNIADDVLEDKQQQKRAKRVKIAENETKREEEKAAADKKATRRSSRASMLMDKASEVVSGITSSVLGKRGRDTTQKTKESTLSAQSTRPTTAPQADEPDTKKARLEPTGDDQSLATAKRAFRSRAPKDKKWLTSGLYAGQTRTFNPSLTETKNKRKSTITTAHQATTVSITPLPPKENFILPEPMFAGARLLETGRDFKLPFDVFSPLPTAPKPDEWKRINKNVFIGDAAAEWRTNTFTEHSTCMCTPSTGCDANCMNRYMYYECDGRNCNLSEEACGNRAFEGLRQRVKKGGRFNIGVEVMRTVDRGYGVRASRCFEPNQIIVEYTGEIINQEECERRMWSMYKDNECYYLMAFDQNMIIDATRGSMARFVNHCCDPNCRMEKWTVGGKPRMALFAGDRGIMTGEELTYDYNFDPYSQKNVQVCRCGADNCRGVLGPKPKDLPKPKEEREKEKESKLAGAKRKISEILEESSNLLNKKRKTNEPPRLPKGWAYIEPEPKAKKEDKGKGKTEGKRRASEDGLLSRRPSKLKRMLSQKSSKSAKVSRSLSLKRRSTASARVVSTSSAAALITGDGDGDDDEAQAEADEDETERPKTGLSTAASLKAKAERLGRSLRGRA